jgi:hypothetical protein
VSLPKVRHCNSQGLVHPYFRAMVMWLLVRLLHHCVQEFSVVKLDSKRSFHVRACLGHPFQSPFTEWHLIVCIISGF